MTGEDLWYKPKLIEVALPLEEINKQSIRENYIYRGNPSAIHKWWAQRPLATCRAVLFAQLVDDPSAHPDQFPTENEQKAERDRLHDIIKQLVVWENIHNEELLKRAHAEIVKSCDGNPPPILEPFAGGGTIPLEARRLGLEVYASDLNPVAVLINKALIEIPPKWADYIPVFPGSVDSAANWPGATGLTEDVRRYGMWIREEAEKRIGNLYPTVEISGVDSTVIAWLWTRTVTCPNPACSGTMPLVKSFWLSKKKGKERYAIPIVDGKRVRFEIGGPDGVPRDGTMGGRTGAVCLICNTPVPMSYIRNEGQAGRMGSQLMAIAAEGNRQRYYAAPTEIHENVAKVARPHDSPDAELSTHPQYMGTPRYGMTNIVDLFTNRQLIALTTLSDLVLEARDRVIADGGSTDYADAVATYLACIVSKTADYNCTGAVWYPNEDRPKNLFARQAIPMIWDYPEINVLADIGGTWTGCLRVVTDAMAGLDVQPGANAHVQQINAEALQIPNNAVTCTDPPYYDNVPYADLSDFFYVWLRRSLQRIYPELLGTMLTPKADELVADHMRHDGKENAERFFEDGFRHVFTQICKATPNDFPITVFYAFKQAESERDGDHASTGWETLLEGMIQSGWAVTATWPARTERAARIRDIKANALASSIVLACRPRPASAGFTDRRGLINALREEFPEALRKLEQGSVAPVDLRQAAIGPGMAIFSRYARVNEPDGTPMRVRAALSLINQVLDEKLSQLEGNVSTDTRFCVEWFKQFEFDQGPYGTAETLSKGIDTSIDGLVRAGVVKSAAGKVKLLSVRDIPDFYDPEADDRASEWEICLHLAKALQDRGADDAARLMAAARRLPAVDLDDVKELAYLLYSIAEKKGWAETALLFNNLGTSWTDLEKLAQTAPTVAAGQGEFTLDFGSDDDGDE
jgi:putative DNA methylase